MKKAAPNPTAANQIGTILVGSIAGLAVSAILLAMIAPLLNTSAPPAQVS